MEDGHYFRQKDLFNVTDVQYPIHVYGCGSVGSHVIMSLAKTGFKDITVYDFDSLEIGNIPAQFYKINQVGVKKTEAIKNMVKEMVDINIKTKDGIITEAFKPLRTPNSIHILAFDNIPARKIVSQQFDGFPVVLIDCRIGGFILTKFSLRCDDNVSFKKYQETLTGTFSETKCGEKCLWPVNMMIASMVTADIINRHKGYTPEFSIIRSLLSNEQIIHEVEQ